MAAKTEIIFWDVQHGHATYIKSPNDRHIAIDLGIGSYKTKKEFSPLKYLKEHYSVKRLDYLIITHPHLDHIDDVLNFDELNPKVFLRPRHITEKEILEGVREEDLAKFKKYCEIDKRYNASVSSENEIRNSENYGGLKVTTFSPKKCPHENINNHSIVTVFEYESTKIVIPGDNELLSFEELMKQESFNNTVKNADILLAPHHGRKSGFCADFINIVNPRLTIISDGRFCDTSANDRYSQKSRGWTVYDNGKAIKRNCLTTNTDGCVYISCGRNSNGKAFLNVKIN
jgi:beta-lactamase superfamily II metal-dependent hydrolase